METLIKFIKNTSFPCIMAKAALQTGVMMVHEENAIDSTESLKNIQHRLYRFVDSYRAAPKKLHSFILTLNGKKYLSFNHFETYFWKFLRDLNYLDKLSYSHDPRVSSQPDDDHFCYSIKEEGFFILTLHPESPRLSRRFHTPAIVFNPHQQFEDLRNNNTYKKIQKIIRRKDKLLQGNINPMLNDFGERSEVFQYTGRYYSPDSQNPYSI